MLYVQPQKFNNTHALESVDVIRTLGNEARIRGITIGLFGSYSRNQQHEESDIDIILFEDGKKLRGNNNQDGFQFWKHLESIFKKKVSIIYYDNMRKEVYISIQKDLIILRP